MRLIDIDEVIKYVLLEGFNCDTQADREAVAEEVEKMFPTIKAIPVEWIENYYKYRVMPRSVEWFEAIQIMLKDWEKENA